MLKHTKVYVAALAAVSTLSFVSAPAFAQAESDDDVIMFVAEPGDGPDMGDFPPPPGGPPDGMGDEGPMAFMLPVPPPSVEAMRGGGFGGPGGGRGMMFRRGGSCGMMGRGGGGCPLRGLDGENALTDAQYEKMYELKNRTLDQIGPKMLELMTASRHLRDALTQENIDDKAVKKLQNQITGLKSDVETIKLNSKVELMQSLTAGQRKALREAMIKGPGGMRGMHKRWGEKREKKEG